MNPVSPGPERAGLSDSIRVDVRPAEEYGVQVEAMGAEGERYDEAGSVFR